MSKAEKAVVPAQEKAPAALALATQQKASDLDAMGVSSHDQQVTTIQLMQNTSKLVGDEKAKLGDIVDMATEEVLGGVDKPVKVMPLKKVETIRVYDVSNNGFKFLREEPLIRGRNDKTLGEAVEDGIPVKRLECLSFVVLLKSELANGAAMPRLIRFRSTGLTAGRTIAAHMYNLRQFWNQMSYQGQYVALSSRKEKKETATYAMFEATLKDKADKLTADQQEFAKLVLEAANANKYSFDEREDTTLDSTATVQAAKQVVVGAEVMGSAQGAY